MDGAFMAGVLIGALLMGVVIGLIPLIIGIVKEQLNLGIIGLVSCIVGNLILGLLLSIPIALIFSIIILTKK